ncbi:MAG: peptide chain release factor N(5)-glutamine methyltransferase, partial [Spirochaetales bacterium]|nr:peptide chain release factor N(5)-glutamine methyltransferase [Spirochaetales bacterium]
SSVIPTLEKQVQFEPKLALDGGKDGLEFIRAIAKKARKHLVPGGLLEMEIGYDQAQSASQVLSENGYTNIDVIQDLGGNDRLVKGLN